jgi:hypothetical protein
MRWVMVVQTLVVGFDEVVGGGSGRGMMGCCILMVRGCVWLTEELARTCGGMVWLLRSTGSQHVISSVGFDDLHGNRDLESPG